MDSGYSLLMCMYVCVLCVWFLDNLIKRVYTYSMKYKINFSFNSKIFGLVCYTQLTAKKIIIIIYFAKPLCVYVYCQTSTEKLLK